jgi:hypothetical protein
MEGEREREDGLRLARAAAAARSLNTPHRPEDVVYDPTGQNAQAEDVE